MGLRVLLLHNRYFIPLKVLKLMRFYVCVTCGHSLTILFFYVLSTFVLERNALMQEYVELFIYRYLLLSVIVCLVWLSERL